MGESAPADLSPQSLAMAEAMANARGQSKRSVSSRGRVPLLRPRVREEEHAARAEEDVCRPGGQKVRYLTAVPERDEG